MVVIFRDALILSFDIILQLGSGHWRYGIKLCLITNK